MKTLKQKYIAALELKGETKVKDTVKYTVMTRHASGLRSGFYYIGVSGGLRSGNTVNASIPCSDTFKQQLIALLGEGQ